MQACISFLIHMDYLTEYNNKKMFYVFCQVFTLHDCTDNNASKKAQPILSLLTFTKNMVRLVTNASLLGFVVVI